jgi:hypothetical protein
MYTFDANYDESGAARAERSFYLRSVIERRRLLTFGPPAFFALVVAVASALAAPGLFVTLFSAFLALSLVGPVFFYIARPLAAKRLARKYPVRHVALTPGAVEITAGDQKVVIPWVRVKYVWETDDYLLLVLSKFASINIPRRNLPEGANEFILASIKSAA